MISRTLLENVGRWLLGTLNTIEGAIEHFDLAYLDPSDIEDQLLDINVERCQGCGWWHESGDLTPDPEEEGNDEELTGYCIDCRKERGGVS